MKTSNTRTLDFFVDKLVHRIQKTFTSDDIEKNNFKIPIHDNFSMNQVDVITRMDVCVTSSDIGFGGDLADFNEGDITVQIINEDLVFIGDILPDMRFALTLEYTV